MIVFLALIKREVHLSLRHGTDTLAVLLFFLVVGSLFPLAIGPAPEILGRNAPGIIWVAALLASLLPLDRLFGSDFDDGSLDQLLLCGSPASAVSTAKACAHWLTTGAPLLVVAVPLAFMLQLPNQSIVILLAGLLPGTALLSLIGTTCAALVLGARRGTVLLPLLVLPLSVPILIFGAAAVDAASFNQSAQSELMLLCALLSAAIPLCPLAAGAALRSAVG